MDVAVDRLSSLPDDLIHKILSFVDIAYSIRLSVLSSRWRFIWTSMPNLSFATNEVSRSSPNHEFVNNVISGRNNQIDVSSVHLMFDAKATEVFVKRILEYAFSHNVQQMTIQMITTSEFPLSLLSSKSLKHLTMISTSIDCRSYSPWDLPALTTLHLQYVEFYSRSSILAMCQNLKNLTLERCEVFEFESCNGFSIINSRLLNLTLKDVEWYVDFVYVDTPQLKNLIIVDKPKSCSISELSGELTISARDLTYLLLKGSHFPKLSLDGFRSLDKVDLSISSPHKTDVHKICELLQRLHSVKSLALSLEIVELLSSSVEVISHQPSPFASLKSLKIYPLMNLEIYPVRLDQEPAAMEINLSTEVKSYLLDGSRNATLTVVSYEEARAIKTTKEAQRLMVNLWNSLEELEAYIKTKRADVKGKKTLADFCYDDFEIRTRGGELSHIFFSLGHIKELLTKVVTSKRVEMQQRYSRLCAEAETVVDKIIDDMKNECDIKQSIFGGYKTISQTQKEELEGVFGEDEVWNAIKGCGSNKAPGPDGFNFGFIIKCWGVIKADLLKSLEWFWETCSISKGCNPSFVTLIPKTQNPIGLSDYRPISLIGCFYKILAKRIKKVIGGLIGDEQNAFIKGRFILDGSLIANEAFDFLKKKKKRAFLLKIDFEKAYVSVNWKFITDTMGQMGFGDKWCKWVKACLNSATVSVLVNGSPTNEFIMERGVRQGVKIGHDDIPVSHLQYADDTLVFGEWSLPNAKNLMRIFKCVQNVSGLKINHLKTKIYGVGVRNDVIERLANRIRVSPGFLPFTYLGLPVEVNMKKIVCWNGIVEKLESVRQNFFWGGNDEKKKLAWVKWDRVISKSSLGGLDIGSLKACNLALLGKWWWRFRVEEDRLWVKLIKSIYGEYGGLGEEGVSRRSSGGKWSDIIKVGNDIEKTQVPFIGYFRKKVGDGCNTLFWLNQWLGDFKLSVRFPILFALESNKQVSMSGRGSWVIDGGWKWEWGWEREVRGRGLGGLEELSNMIQSFVPNSLYPDAWRWSLDEKGHFSVKSLRNMIDEKTLSNSSTVTQETKWCKIIPRKVSIFIWRLKQKRLPVLKWLNHIGMDLHSTMCPHCNEEEESITHCFLTYSRVSDGADIAKTTRKEPKIGQKQTRDEKSTQEPGIY
ncbi:F-box domain containing protein [Tanacetum coccineum]